MKIYLPFEEDYSFKHLSDLYDVDDFIDSPYKSMWTYTTENIEGHKKAIQ